MKIKKIATNTNPENKANYPVRVYLTNGRQVLIPNQKKFGAYCLAHGCSVTAVSVALQCLGKKQKDGTAYNPKEVYSICKKKIPAYNGSKLGIYGCMKVINKIYGSEVAHWYPNTGKDRETRSKLYTALKKGHVVLFEEDDPVHTVAILGLNNAGKLIVATNGNTVERSLSYQVSKGLHGAYGEADKQKNWWNGSAKGAGYVIVEC